jgi:hypothetical protein
MNPLQAKRHAYLPGLAAYDKSHSKSAVQEINYAGPHQQQPGKLFVDSTQARDALVDRLTVRHTKVMDKLLAGNLGPTKTAALQEKYRQLRHAMNNVHVVGNALGGGHPADTLFVKGHGSPKRPGSITTLTAPVNVSMLAPDGIFPNPTKVQMKRGFKMQHTAQEIANAVSQIGLDLQTPAMDVRITSCGSGGLVSRAPVAPPFNPGQTFAGRVSAALDAMNVPRGIQVSGFQGDTNSTFPSRNMGGSGFTTALKQKDDHHASFALAVQRQTAKVGQGNIDVRLEPVKRPLRDFQLGQDLRQAAPMPPIGVLGPLSPALQGAVQPYTKVETMDQVRKKRVAVVPRDATMVTIPRA